MLGVLLTTAVLILIITNRHFNEQTKRYHEDILMKKEKAVLLSINYLLDSYPEVNEDNIVKVLETRILEINDIQKLSIVIYDLRGNQVLTTEARNPKYPVLPQNILDSLNKNDQYIEYGEDLDDERSYYASYNYIKDVTETKKLAIVALPYETNDVFLQEDMNTLIGSYGVAFVFIILLGAIMIYVVSKNTFNRLTSFADRIKETEVITNNLPILYDKDDEIKLLVDAYNEMLIKLKDQSELLADIERQEAWREFARQVAHEIKNPLTPMKLMIQNYMRKFETDDALLDERTKRTASILMQQIDTIESIADAFSDFAKMPSRKDELIDVVEITKNTLDIFNVPNITFTSSKPVIKMYFDKQYLNRIITNIVKNAFQAIPHTREPIILVDLSIDRDKLVVIIEDNGKGISEEDKKEVFKPRFTTKSSGSGIGLSMVKKIIEDYDGEITFESTEDVGTKFIIHLPYNHE
ncbi:MAG: GHKL domain-containing protein [Weeksellaceae bacterium]|nr:GHKL domain-containing protein [Weeksellaceae bacterium]